MQTHQLWKCWNMTYPDSGDFGKEEMNQKQHKESSALARSVAEPDNISRIFKLLHIFSNIT